MAEGGLDPAAEYRFFGTASVEALTHGLVSDDFRRPIMSTTPHIIGCSSGLGLIRWLQIYTCSCSASLIITRLMYECTLHQKSRYYHDLRRNGKNCHPEHMLNLGRTDFCRPSMLISLHGESSTGRRSGEQLHIMFTVFPLLSCFFCFQPKTTHL